MPRVVPRSGLVVAAIAAVVVFAPLRANARDLIVFAAASLTTAMETVAENWRAESGQRALISPASSSNLARQIQQGAPADLYLSASPDWMDLLEKDGLILPGTRRDLWRNTLVLIAHGEDRPPITLGPESDLAGLLGDGYLATALVDAVPAGVYARTALTSLGLWDQVAGRLAQSDTVRGALAMVATGEAPYGIVYVTDAHAQPQVSVVATFPASSHAPILYPGAVIADSQMPDAALAFLDYLEAPASVAVFTGQGFGPVH